jgi:hypothetical protein
MSTTDGAASGRACVGHEILARGKQGLDLLQQAHLYAQCLGRGVWDFALDLNALNRVGLSTNDLRWLLLQGLLAHAHETTVPATDRRTFRPAGAIGFERKSCFVLTAAGVEFVRQGAVCRLQTPSSEYSAPKSQQMFHPNLPVWDEQRRELRVGDKVVKRFATPAPNQELILATFQEDGWPVRIDDPLPPLADQEPKRRLHDTINSLNRHQQKHLIRFIGDGSGEGIRWEPIVAEETGHSAANPS